MDYKDTWTDADFAEMGWHDATLYSMSFPQSEADYQIRFDIDYIFKWYWECETVQGWDVAPSMLQFNNVSNLKVSLDWQMMGDTCIQGITRGNARPSPNGKFVLWDYRIELDAGDLSFTATGFIQTVQKQPSFSASQSLGRVR